MEYFSYIFCGVLLVLPLILGLLVIIFPPKHISENYGFLTFSTTRDDDSWHYGQRIGGRCLIIFSCITIPLYSILLVVFNNFFVEHFYLMIVISICIVVLETVISFIIVERKTRKYNLKKFYSEKKK